MSKLSLSLIIEDVLSRHLDGAYRNIAADLENAIEAAHIDAILRSMFLRPTCGNPNAHDYHIWMLHDDPKDKTTRIVGRVWCPGAAQQVQPEMIPWAVLDEVLNADSVVNDYRMKPRVLSELRARGYGPVARV